MATYARPSSLSHLRTDVFSYGNTNEAMGFCPGQPTEMRSDVPSHVTSVTTTTATAAIAIVRRRGILG